MQHIPGPSMSTYIVYYKVWSTLSLNVTLFLRSYSNSTLLQYVMLIKFVLREVLFTCCPGAIFIKDLFSSLFSLFKRPANASSRLTISSCLWAGEFLIFSPFLVVGNFPLVLLLFRFCFFPCFLIFPFSSTSSFRCLSPRDLMLAKASSRLDCRM